MLGVITAQDLAEISFDDLEEPNEPAAAEPEKKENASSILLICGLASLLIAALVGHDAVMENITRETSFIVLLILGVVLSVIGMYILYGRKNKVV